ncbi:MAG: tripartite tricarboxylate transporter TctB family protein [Pirellulaceae bacterium]|nr:tripartite tricarboxylate transporter TctB family protein [Pirellulaceae bacterium]
MNWIRLRLGILAGLLLLAGCGGRGEFPRRPITLVCPWAAGGGTDRVSRQLAVHLEQELGKPVNVINATGGKGVTGHRRGLQARSDGYTLAMVTVELNMLHWSGLTQLDWRDCQPLMSINEDYAALLVRDDAPWHSLAELEAAVRAQPGRLRASGTASGGIWHLALAGWLRQQGLAATDVVWISSAGAGPSLQELISGGLDMVCCSLPEASSLYKSGKVRAVGVMAPERLAGFDEVPTFVEQGTDWSLGGWRGLALPLGTPPDRVEVLERALRRVVTGQTKVMQVLGDGQNHPQTFPEFLQAQGFDSTWRERAEFTEFLAAQDDKFGRLLTSDAMRSVGRDPFPAWAFPAVVSAVLGMSLLALAIGRIRGESSTQGATALPWPPPRRGIIHLGAVLGAMLLYLALSETVGFVLTGGAVLLALLLLFGTRWRQALLIALLVTPAVYQVFANVLRVPLPRGLLGW